MGNIAIQQVPVPAALAGTWPLPMEIQGSIMGMIGRCRRFIIGRHNAQGILEIKPLNFNDINPILIAERKRLAGIIADLRQRGISADRLPDILNSIYDFADEAISRIPAPDNEGQSILCIANFLRLQPKLIQLYDFRGMNPTQIITLAQSFGRRRSRRRSKRKSSRRSKQKR